MLLAFCLLVITVGASSGTMTFLNPQFLGGEGVLQIEGDSVNIALVGKPSTSFVSGWESLEAVNDNFTPSNSNDKSHGAYGNWSNPNSLQWVQYEWTTAYIVNSVELYWFDDGGGVLTPTEAYIEYYQADSWIRSTDVPCVKNTFNKAYVGGVLVSKIRVVMKNTTQSTGILEFRVWGTNSAGGSDIEAPTSPGTPKVLASTDTSLTVTWKSSTDNEEIEGYQLLKNDTLLMTVTDTIATIKGLAPNTDFLLSVRSVDASQNQSAPGGSIWVSFGSSSTAGLPYSWPAYSPTLNYNFRDEFPALAEPTKDLDDCPQVVGTQSSGWWTFKWGKNARSLVTEAAITPMLERMNKDFAYFRDTLGWPPDKRAKEGYRSAIYLFGSGLTCIDNADSNALGGWQSGIGSYACVLASYYPVYSFDPACPYPDKEGQQGAMVHEGIHSILADLPGCKKAAWFHEGGNTWLQQEASARQSQNYSEMGFLNAGTFIAPFMPIECYSGWLQDGSFGGPSAEGVNRYNSKGAQLCTWRNLLGGTQYGNGFPSFLGTVLGEGSVAWIWRNCPERVLEGMAGGLGDMQLRRLIMEYRAKQALIDMKQWSGAVKKLLDSNFGASIRAEYSPIWIVSTKWVATPYVKTWMLDSTKAELTPEPRTTPGWSGSNQIPLKVSGDTVVVDFIPLGENMTCQLCYRATDGTAVYSKPVSSGLCSLTLDQEPANGVVIAVITNTDYIYKGEETRMAHYDYRLQLKKGIAGKASIYKKWYDYNSVIVDKADPVEPFPTEGPLYVPEDPATSAAAVTPSNKLKIYPNPVNGSEIVNVDFSNHASSPKTVRILNMQGQVVYTSREFSDSKLELPASGILNRGMYFINVQSLGLAETYKLIVN